MQQSSHSRRTFSPDIAGSYLLAVGNLSRFQANWIPVGAKKTRQKTP
jgi:hypothetical protein